LRVCCREEQLQIGDLFKTFSVIIISKLFIV
jgi:hypothetical protein